MFELHDVWKGEKKATSRDQWTLAGVTVAFPAGSRIALIGPDSAKNSAVLRILSGVDEPDRGAIRRVGTTCWPLDYGGFIEPRATVNQNANFLAQVYGVDASEVTRIAARLSGVKLVRGKPMNQYLGTDKRALMLGLTLAFQFDWYFVDERLPRAPEETAAEVDAAIKDRLSRASVIWATSKPETLDGFCDAALLLDQGSLTFYSKFEDAVDAFRQTNETKIVRQNDRKSRKAGRRRRAARRAGEIDTQDAR